LNCLEEPTDQMKVWGGSRQEARCLTGEGDQGMDVGAAEQSSKLTTKEKIEC
jgi:hypothetical protein